MSHKRSTIAAKRLILAVLLSSSAHPASKVQAELVEVSLNDTTVGLATAIVPQDNPLVPPPTPAQPTAPQGTPASPGLAAQGTAPVTPVPPNVAQPAAPPISEPFANPLPNAALNQFTPPAPPTAPAGRSGSGLGLGGSLGITAGSVAFAPTMMGDLFGGGVSLVGKADPVVTQFFSPGTILSGSGSTALLAYDFGTGTPNDIFSAAGTGTDASGDGQVDTFEILEPVAPTDAPTSPGAGFVFAGGQAVYTNANSGTAAADGVFTNADTWFVSYSYAADFFGNGGEPVVIAGPDSATRRVKLSENFSPEVRNRFFFNYNFFNDAFGGLGDVSRYILGVEQVLIEDLMSLEVRLPMAGTLSSRQQADAPGNRDFELGNATLIGKWILLKTDRFTLTGGTGITATLADDARILRGDDEILRIENEAVHLLPFVGLLHRYDRKTFFQAYGQLDVDVQGNPVLANLAGGPLVGIGRFTDSTLVNLDVSAHRMIFEARSKSDTLKAVVANAELHYTGTLQESDVVRGGGVTIGNLARHFNILNATFGAHLLLGDRLVVTPGIAVPLRDGTDEQFDYEALVQVSYQR